MCVEESHGAWQCWSTSEQSKFKQLLFTTCGFLQPTSSQCVSHKVPPDAKAADLFAPFFDVSTNAPPPLASLSSPTPLSFCLPPLLDCGQARWKTPAKGCIRHATHSLPSKSSRGAAAAALRFWNAVGCNGAVCSGSGDGARVSGHQRCGHCWHSLLASICPHQRRRGRCLPPRTRCIGSFWRWCGQRPAPPHSLHMLLRRWCKQNLAPHSPCICSFSAGDGRVLPPPQCLLWLSRSTFDRWIHQVPLQIRVRVRGPEHINIVVGDLPGMINAGDGKVASRELIQRYIKEEKTLILLVSEAKQDKALTSDLDLAQEFDPRPVRTLRILPKVRMISIDKRLQYPTPCAIPAFARSSLARSQVITD
jgi:hypothetical protein